MRADYLTALTAAVPDPGGAITDADRERALDQAVARYSDDRPQRLKGAVTATETHRLPVPAGWASQRSRLVEVRTPETFDDRHTIAAELHAQLDGSPVIVLGVGVDIGSSWWVVYTAPHLLTTLADTIPVPDQEAVTAWASAVLFGQLAAGRSGDRSSTIRADSVDHAETADAFAARARECRKRYHDLLGIDPKANVAGGVTVDWSRPAPDGRSTLTRGRSPHRLGAA